MRVAVEWRWMCSCLTVDWRWRWSGPGLHEGGRGLLRARVGGITRGVECEPVDSVASTSLCRDRAVR
jgi:hypothetical protein